MAQAGWTGRPDEVVGQLVAGVVTAGAWLSAERLMMPLAFGLASAADGSTDAGGSRIAAALLLPMSPSLAAGVRFLDEPFATATDWLAAIAIVLGTLVLGAVAARVLRSRALAVRWPAMWCACLLPVLLVSLGFAIVQAAPGFARGLALPVGMSVDLLRAAAYWAVLPCALAASAGCIVAFALGRLGTPAPAAGAPAAGSGSALLPTSAPGPGDAARGGGRARAADGRSVPESASASGPASASARVDEPFGVEAQPSTRSADHDVLAVLALVGASSALVGAILAYAVGWANTRDGVSPFAMAASASVSAPMGERSAAPASASVSVSASADASAPASLPASSAALDAGFAVPLDGVVESTRPPIRPFAAGGARVAPAPVEEPRA